MCECLKMMCRRICRFAAAKLENTVALLAENAVRKESTHRRQKKPFWYIPEADYLGLADIPAGANLRLTSERTVRSKHIYLWRAEAVL